MGFIAWIALGVAGGLLANMSPVPPPGVTTRASVVAANRATDAS